MLRYPLVRRLPYANLAGTPPGHRIVVRSECVLWGPATQSTESLQRRQPGRWRPPGSLRTTSKARPADRPSPPRSSRSGSAWTAEGRPVGLFQSAPSAGAFVHRREAGRETGLVIRISDDDIWAVEIECIFSTGTRQGRPPHFRRRYPDPCLSASTPERTRHPTAEPGGKQGRRRCARPGGAVYPARTLERPGARSSTG